MDEIVIVGLSGAFGGGKDASAAVLVEHGFGRVAYADMVRREIGACAIKHDLPADAPAWVREALFSVRRMPLREIWAKPTSPMARRLLQWWGTDYRRAQDVNYWVKGLAQWVEELGWHKVVISDLRFANEAAWIQRQGGRVWRVERDVDDAEERSHSSEHGLDDFEHDGIILNNGTLDDLRRNILACISKGANAH